MSTTEPKIGDVTDEPTALPEIRSRRGTPTWELAELLHPHQGEWTEEEYLALGTNWMIEYTDGCLEFLPMPTLFHQFISRFLLGKLEGYILPRELGVVSFAPVPVRLRKRKYREPDLMFFRKDRVKDPRHPPDGADLVMEIVSPGKQNRERDLKKKPKEYARAGIAEYWIIDPEQRRITVLALEGKQYRVHGEFGPGQTATSVLLPGFAVSVDETFAAGEAMGTTDQGR